ncbi:histidinol dehydrogenase [Ornithinibacillus sp. 4-3]|uniref:Histidinol dehydrogenase n=1 Tax=Ornithinibacillus sp. 4-3 TaxID=3231488 RepID=A0AB39HN84_9BACI
MKIVTWKQYEQEQVLQKENLVDEASIDEVVLSMIAEVRSKGDAALFAYTEQFDQVRLDHLLVSQEEWEEAMAAIDLEFMQSIQKAHDKIEKFHKLQKERSWMLDDEPGILLGQKVTAIDRVGIYVPGGKAAYPSTVLMNAVPAKIAGVSKIVITTPPQADGKINPYILAAAKIAGVETVYKVGGAQAIAALAYGTETITKVNKIVGPGNAYVASAKKWVFGEVAIDMIAGPSEICVMADQATNPVYAAADLLSQAEHDERAKAICVTTSKQFAETLKEEIYQQTELAERKAIIQSSIEDYGRIVLVDSLEEMYDFVNHLAPEHLQIMLENPIEHLGNIQHAGAIFLGEYAPEALGDYIAGPNHTLPTSGTAVFSSPLGVYDFMKKSSVIYYSKEALSKVGEDVMRIANAEGLFAHANSIKKRMDE